MTKVVFGQYNFKRRWHNGAEEVFDEVRRKHVALTPEEWVRQHVLHYLFTEKKYPKTLVAVEKEIVVNGLRKRCDVVAFNRSGAPILLVECKADSVNITDEALRQILNYNQKLNVKYLWVTNGLHHYCFDAHSSGMLLNEIPDYTAE